MERQGAYASVFTNLTASDGEVEGLHGENLVVVVSAAAVALADGDLELVRAGRPRVVLIRLGVKLELARVGARLGVVEETAAVSNSAGAEDDNADRANASPLSELVGDVKVELGAGVASLRLDRQASDVGLVIIRVVAGVELLAKPDGIGISTEKTSERELFSRSGRRTQRAASRTPQCRQQCKGGRKQRRGFETCSGGQHCRGPGSHR